MHHYSLILKMLVFAQLLSLGKSFMRIITHAKPSIPMNVLTGKDWLDIFDSLTTSFLQPNVPEITAALILIPHMKATDKRRLKDEAARNERLKDIETRHNKQTQYIEASHEQRLKDIETTHNERSKYIEVKHDEHIKYINARHDELSQYIQARHDELSQYIEARYDERSKYI